MPTLQGPRQMRGVRRKWAGRGPGYPVLSAHPCADFRADTQLDQLRGVYSAPWKYINLPAHVLKRTHEGQRGWVSWQVRRHFRESCGVCPLFCTITGYHWHYARDCGLSFDTRGRQPKTSGST